eukprot:m.87042 g.87042  ORF g.87042 m.87042 type:complete len:1360 (+) comp14894_c0_seq1:436-4515(+)
MGTPALLAWASVLCLASVALAQDPVPVVLSQCASTLSDGIVASRLLDEATTGSIALTVVDGTDGQTFSNALSAVQPVAVVDGCDSGVLPEHQVLIASTALPARHLVYGGGLYDSPDSSSVLPTPQQAAEATVAAIDAVGWKRFAVVMSSAPSALQMAADLADAAMLSDLQFSFFAYPLQSAEAQLASVMAEVAVSQFRVLVFVAGAPCDEQGSLVRSAAIQAGITQDNGFVWFLSALWCDNPVQGQLSAEWPSSLVLEPATTNPDEFWPTAAAADTVTTVVQVARQVFSSQDITADAFASVLAQVSFQGNTSNVEFDASLRRINPLFFLRAANSNTVAATVQGTNVVFDDAVDLGLAPLTLDRPAIEVNVAFAVARSGSQIGRISQERELAFRAAIDFVNDADDNTRIRLVPTVFDTGIGCEETANRIVATLPPIHVLVGPGSSSCAMAMSPTLTAQGIVHIGFSETSPRLSDKEQFPLFFRVPPSDLFQGNGLAQMAQMFEWERVGTIGTTDAYGSDLAARFEQSMLAGGFEITASPRFEAGSTGSIVRESLQELKAGGSAVQLLSCSASDAVNVLALATEIGIAKPGYSWIGTDGSAGLTLSEVLGDNFVGMLGLQPRSGEGDVWNSFLQFDGPNSMLPLATQSELRYVPHILDAVRTIHSAVSLSAAQETLVTQPDSAQLQTLLTQGLRQYNSSANGIPSAVGGNFFFDAQQDGPPRYNVVNLQRNNMWARVGVFAPETGLEFTEEVVFSNGLSTPPGFVPPVDEDSQSDPGTDTGTLVAAVLVPAFVLLALLLLYILVLHRRVNKAARKRHSFEKEIAQLHDLIKFEELTTPVELERHNLRSLEQLGHGFYGFVHKGLLQQPKAHTSTLLEFLVAIKTLKEEASAQQLELLLTEAALLAQFRHPNIVRLWGVVTVGQPMAMVLEYCEHGALNSYLRSFRGPHALSTEAKVGLASGAAAGLDFVHQCGCLHRDVACRNFLVGSDFKVKLSDFGKAVRQPDMLAGDDEAVPVRWTAPEVLVTGQFSQATDIWSFGVVLWEIWTDAEKPYGRMANRSVQEFVRGGGRLEQPARCPPEIYEMMKNCWAAQQSARPTSQAISQELEDMVSDLAQANIAVSARPSGTLQPSRPSRTSYLQEDVGVDDSLSILDSVDYVLDVDRPAAGVSAASTEQEPPAPNSRGSLYRRQTTNGSHWVDYEPRGSEASASTSFGRLYTQLEVDSVAPAATNTITSLADLEQDRAVADSLESIATVGQAESDEDDYVVPGQKQGAAEFVYEPLARTKEGTLRLASLSELEHNDGTLTLGNGALSPRDLSSTWTEKHGTMVLSPARHRNNDGNGNAASYDFDDDGPHIFEAVV